LLIQIQKNYPGIDAYIIETFIEDDNKRVLFESDKAYWHNQFDTTRRNRSAAPSGGQGKQSSKGFLEIIY